MARACRRRADRAPSIRSLSIRPVLPDSSRSSRSPSAVSSTGWKSAKLIERRPDPADRRAYRLFLTEAARPVVTEFRAIAHECVSRRRLGVSDAEIDRGHRCPRAHPREPRRSTGRKRSGRRSGSNSKNESGRPLMSADGGNPKVVEMKAREGEAKPPPASPQPAPAAGPACRRRAAAAPALALDHHGHRPGRS